MVFSVLVGGVYGSLSLEKTSASTDWTHLRQVGGGTINLQFAQEQRGSLKPEWALKNILINFIWSCDSMSSKLSFANNLLKASCPSSLPASPGRGEFA